MSRPSVIDRARADLAAGRAWKARDRLQGARASAPYDQEILGLLGEVAWSMGDLPAAGAAWWLTERTGPDVDAALAALRERAGDDPEQLLRMIKPGRPATRYPEPVVARIRALVDEAEPWDRYRRLFEEKPARPGASDLPGATWAQEAMASAAAGALVAPWFIGVGTVAVRALRAARRLR